MATKEKLAQMKEWPEYKSCDDIRSHVHFVEYLKEMIPELPEIIFPLRKYLKKGANFAEYATDWAAQNARKRLIEVVLDKCVLIQPDWKAAADPFKSGRPLEIFEDASDFGWCVTLAQRLVPMGTVFMGRVSPALWEGV